MVTSDFRREVVVFRTCAMKIMQLFMSELQKFSRGLGYGADTTFRRTYFKKMAVEMELNIVQSRILYTVSQKKVAHVLLSISLLNYDRFS